MPTLEEDPSLLAGYNASEGYVQLPELQPDTPLAELLAAGNRSARESFALADFKSFASVTQGMMATQAGRMKGVPSWVAKPFTKVFTEIPLVEGKNLISFAIEQGTEVAIEALNGSAEVVAEAVADAVSIVPIVGAVVKIGIKLGMRLASEIAAERAAKEHVPEHRPLVYDYANDQLQGNVLAGIASSGDWTDAFMPQSSDPEFIALRLALSKSPRPRTGVRWEIPNWTIEKNGGWGLVPGIADQVGTYQSIDLFQARTDGDRMPSGSKFATVLWQAAMRPSVQMFLIDSHRIESAWEGYFHNLWKFSDRDFSDIGIDDEFSRIWLRARIRQSASYLALYDCAKKTKFGTCPPDSEPVFKPESVIKAFPRDLLAKKLGGSGKLTGLYSDITRYVCKVHRKAAARALQTLVVAYTPSDAPLLKADASLAKQHVDMRKLLLSHRDRYLVELDLVPRETDTDKAWYSKLQDSRILTESAINAINWDLGFQAGGSGGKSKGTPLIAAIPAGLVLPDPDIPPVGLPEGTDSGAPGADSGTGWALAMGLGAALVGGAVVLSRRRRGR